MKHVFRRLLVRTAAVSFSISSVYGQSIERLDPALDALIAPDAKLVMITDLGEEGPLRQ